MRLPEKLDEDFWQEAGQYEEKEKMPYISSVEGPDHRFGLDCQIRAAGFGNPAGPK